MHRMRRVLTILAGITVIIVGAAFVGWNVIGTQVPWQSAVSASGHERSLEISYVGSSCQDTRTVDVAQDARSVTITIVERTFRVGCDDTGVARTVTVELDADLGQRELRDGSCDRPRDCVRTVR